MDAASIEMKGGSLSLNVRGVDDDPWKMPAARESDRRAVVAVVAASTNLGDSAH
jgi:hypothetical protein